MLNACCQVCSKKKVQLFVDFKIKGMKECSTQERSCSEDRGGLLFAIDIVSRPYLSRAENPRSRELIVHSKFNCQQGRNKNPRHH